MDGLTILLIFLDYFTYVVGMYIYLVAMCNYFAIHNAINMTCSDIIVC